MGRRPRGLAGTAAEEQLVAASTSQLTIPDWDVVQPCC